MYNNLKCNPRQERKPLRGKAGALTGRRITIERILGITTSLQWMEKGINQQREVYVKGQAVQGNVGIAKVELC